ncbi:MAG: hypothetical protein KIS73_13825 [Enhydrobacter sp.]|nr:hypothetical protein [Enhydrobacter sp.]
MTMRSVCVLVMLVSLSLPAVASAQAGSVDWMDIDCAQSRIAPTDGLRCRASDKLTSDALATGEGLYRFWNASGSIGDTKYYYYVAEALSPKALIVGRQDLPDAVRGRSPQGRGSAKMSDVSQRQDADVVFFESAAKESCIGIRKTGPGTVQGAKWILYATRCVPQGQPVTDGDVAAFVDQARIRE